MKNAKNRWEIFLIVLIALAGLWVPAAAAEESGAELPVRMEVEEGGVFQQGAFVGTQTIPGDPELMSSLEQTMYDRILAGYRARAKKVDFEDLKTNERDLLYQTVQRVLNDHPELFYGRWYVSWVYPDRIAYIELTYYDFSYYGYSSIDGAIADFNAAVNQALAVIEPGMTDLEKTLALHDYLVEHCAYNWEVAVIQSPEELSEFWKTNQNHQLATAFGALVNGDAICQSYSLAYKLLLNQAGIDAIMIGSSAMNHVWNGIRLGENWYQTDVTWDDPVPDRPGHCGHSNFLVSDATLGKNHHDWEQQVTCSDTTYESGWIFNNARHTIGRWNGRYYYTENNGNQLIRLCVSPTLKADRGTVFHDGPGGSFYLGALWKDGYLYFVPYASDGDYRLMRCSLNTGKVSQLGAFSFTEAPSPDGNYPESYDTIGLRFSQDGKTIEAVSATRRSVTARFPILPDLSTWERQAAGAVGIAGLAGDGTTAGIFWSASAPRENMTLWAAFYQNGKMQALRSCTVPSVVYWASDPDLKLVQLNRAGLPAYDEVRLILIRDDGAWKPYCPAKTA